jgi:hypothetical protein
MHFDEMPLDFLGEMNVERASDIKYFTKGKCWEIIIAGDSIPRVPAQSGFSTYEAARAFEVEWFQACRKEGATPKSERGLQIAIDLRGAM